MLKNDGFYIAELMLSLACWLLIAGFFVPYLMQVKKQIVQVEQQSAALHILYETIQTILIEHPENVDDTVVKGGVAYELIWREGEQELCIRYEDVWRQRQQFCAKIP